MTASLWLHPPLPHVAPPCPALPCPALQLLLKRHAYGTWTWGSAMHAVYDVLAEGGAPQALLDAMEARSGPLWQAQVRLLS